MENWGKIEGLNKKDLEKLQNKKLSYFLKNVISKSPYYVDLFKKNKIKLSEIKTVSDLRKIPFTTKEDIAPPNNPERFIIKGEKPVHVHFTAGRTAAPTPFFYTEYDLNNLKEVGKRLFNIFKADKKDIAVNAFPYAPHLAFWQSYFALNAAGVMALHSGGGKVLGTEKIIRSAAGMKATTLLGMPGYIYHLLRVASEEKVNLKSVNKIILGGERVDQGLKDKLKSFLGNKARILSTYGFTEGKCVWGQCSENSGYHLYPDLEYIEIVDKNGEDVGEGEKGEIVYTALDWRGSVVLRYKTGDLVDGIYYDKCECGRTIRLGNKIERTSEVKEFNLVKLKGNLVNLNVFYSIINQFKEIEEWQIVIKKRNNDPYELDELYLYVSTKKTDFEKLKTRINEKVKEATEITFSDIIQVKNEEMINRLGLETELKERRIVDKR